MFESIHSLPTSIFVTFGITLLLAVALFVKAANYSQKILALLAAWIIFQTLMSLSGFYKIANTVPPRFGLLIIPPLILIVSRFYTDKGKSFLDNLDVKTLTLIHVLRVPVELVLYGLFAHGLVPELMTFEGRNFDLFSGLTAPFVYYFGYVKKSLSNSFMLVWNFICLALVVNVAMNAVLSLPSVFQLFALDQPNTAILQFPFVLLPSVLVPLVLLAHLTAIRQLLRNRKK